MRFEADGVDAGIWALTASQVAQRIGYVDVFVVERLRLCLASPPARAAPESDRFAMTRSAPTSRPLDRELPHRSAAPDRDGVASLMLQFSAAM